MDSAPDPFVMDPTKTAQRPFIGLRAFAPGDAAFYFGREDQIDRLQELLARGSMIAVVGSSGSGKSSLVRAGLLHRITSSQSERWEFAEMRPGEAPVRRLAEALASPNKPAGEASYDPLAEARADRIELRLQASSFGIRDSLELLGERDGDKLVILVDQFEEIFRFADLRERRIVDPRIAAEQRDEATQFVQLLLTAANDPNFPAKIIITMRSDFIGECARFHGLSEAVTEYQYLVPSLTRDQRETAILGPIAGAGGSIEPALLQRLLNDTNEDLDQLPILQHAMMRCWHYAAIRHPYAPHLTLDQDYAAIGGIENALTQHANEVLSELQKDDRPESGTLASGHVAQRLFQCLTETDSQGRTIRRPQTFGGLLAVLVSDGAGDDEVVNARNALRHVIARFSDPDCSFLRAAPVDQITDETVIDIGHEALIRRWERLGGPDERSWVKQESEDAQKYRDLVSQADFGGTIDEEPLRAFQAWWRNRQPNRAWALRYSRNGVERLDAARSVLDRSEKIIAQRLEAARRGRRNKQRALVALCCSIALAVGGLWMWQDAANVKRVREAKQEIFRGKREKSQLVATLGLQGLRLQDPHTGLLIAKSGLENAKPAVDDTNRDDTGAGADVPALYLVAYTALQQLRETAIIHVGNIFMAVAYDKDDRMVTFMNGTLRVLDRTKLFREDDESADAVTPVVLPRLSYAINIETSADGDLTLVGNSTQTYLVDMRDKKATYLTLGNGDNGSPVGIGTMTRDGTLLLTSKRGDDPILWSVTRDARTARLDIARQEILTADVDDSLLKDVTAVAFSADGKFLALGTASSKILLFEGPHYHYVRTLEYVAVDQASSSGGGQVSMLTFNPRTPNQILAAYQARYPRLYQWNENKVAILDGGEHAFRVAFSPSGDLLAAPPSNGGRVDLWRTADVVAQRDLAKVPPLMKVTSRETFYQVTFDHEENLAGGSSIGHVWEWDTHAAALSKGLSDDAPAFDVKPETKLVSSNGTDVMRDEAGRYVVRSSVAGVLPGPVKTPGDADWNPGHPGDLEWKLTHMALSSDGKWLALTPAKGSILLYDLGRPDVADPSQVEGQPIAAFGDPDFSWQRPAVFSRSGEPHITATGQDGRPVAWRYFESLPALLDYTEKVMPLSVYATASKCTRKTELQSSVQEELDGDLWPGLKQTMRPSRQVASLPPLPTTNRCSPPAKVAASDE